MEYKLYKLKFKTGVHLGNGLLNDSSYIVKADTLFSAMCIEAVKVNKIEQLYDMANNNRLLISDTMPYIDNDVFLIPKPMLYIESDKKGDSTEKKKIKNMKYIPIKNLEDYLNGNIDKIDEKTQKIGYFDGVTKARVRNLDDKNKMTDTVPYHVGVYNYDYNVGLYIILGYKDENENLLIESLMRSLTYVGIGGKRSSGLGKFELSIEDIPSEFKERIYCEENKDKFKEYMSLSVSLPKEDELKDELKNPLENSSYLLEKRSGFIYSDSYSDEFRRKKDLYVFSSGSCFKNIFGGDIYNVAEQLNTHDVYRYAKPLFLGVRRSE